MASANVTTARLRGQHIKASIAPTTRKATSDSLRSTADHQTLVGIKAINQAARRIVDVPNSRPDSKPTNGTVAVPSSTFISLPATMLLPVRRNMQATIV